MITILLGIISLLILFLIYLVISFRISYIRNVNVLYNKIKNVNDSIHKLTINNEQHMLNNEQMNNIIKNIKDSE